MPGFLMTKLDLNGSFAGQTVIVTGSSSGIGRAIALSFATHGANVVVHGQNDDKLKEVSRTIKDLGIPDENFLLIKGPIQDDATQDRIVNESLKKFGRINTLVNNAAISQKSGADPNSLESLDAVYRTNLRAVYSLTNRLVPHLLQTQGNVVNISSAGSQRGTHSFVPYAMLKEALDHFTRDLALQHAKAGLRVNAVNPGVVATNFIGRHGAPAEVVEQMRTVWAEKTIPMRRVAQPAEVANLVRFLASDEASYITGTTMAVDGGIWAGSPSES